MCLKDFSFHVRNQSSIHSFVASVRDLASLGKGPRDLIQPAVILNWFAMAIYSHHEVVRGLLAISLLSDNTGNSLYGGTYLFRS